MTPDQLARIHAAAFTQSRPWSTSEFASFIQDPACLVVGDVHGFALVRVVLDEAELLTIATHPEHQRQGLARLMMIEWQKAAQARGATRAFLEVAADNTAAFALYQSQGFVESGRRKGYYRRAGQPAVDAIVLARSLP